MKISALIFVVCFSLVHCETKFTEDELIILRIEKALESSSSPPCKKDLQQTIAAYRDKKAWAIASKRKKIRIFVST